ncbi:MAG TPA: DUF3298 and DUF4163 domain-containing protein, partial [Anseongella sp.]|nr:DUF3298 and DUF4163 domain-containing protein [Anseongella sp.]
ALAACGGNKGDPGRGLRAPVNYVTMRVFEQESGCDTATSECTSIYLSYPRIIGSGNNALNDTLSAQVEAWLTGTPDGQGPAASPEEFSKAFISDYEQFAREFPESRAKWYIKRKIEIIANNNHFITLQLSEESYLGGAHGMNVHLFASFDPSGGQRITLEDLVEPGRMAQLEKTAESFFRRETNIPEGQSLKDAGYFYMEEDSTGSPFRLTDNFAITREGLLFYYNPYDIAPYSMGATVLKVPFRDIREALKTDGLLKGYIE